MTTIGRGAEDVAPPTVQVDVCIVGSGVAGVTLARQLASAGISTCMLESGDDPGGPEQQLAIADNVGLPYPRLAGSLCRGFGGTSHLWCLPVDDGVGLRLRPLDRTDFDRRDWVPHSGWPFAIDHLEPYYRRAQDEFGLDQIGYEASDWRDARRVPIALDADKVSAPIFQFAPARTFFEDRREECATMANLAVVLHATVTNIRLDEHGSRVETVRVERLPESRFLVEGGAPDLLAPLADATRFDVRATVFVLAAGAIENPRLLLLANDVHNDGIGNRHDLVGRYFMEHPHLRSGRLVPTDPSLLEGPSFYATHRSGRTTIVGKVALTPSVLAREQILGYCAELRRSLTPNGLRSLSRVVGSMRRGRPPQSLPAHLRSIAGDLPATVDALRHRRADGSDSSAAVALDLDSMSEQAPNPSSRVGLGSRRDAFGRPVAAVDWRLSDLDMHTVAVSQKLLRDEFQRAGVGRFLVDQTSDRPPFDLHGGWHQMGTTRMHMDARHGVVDEHCQVHGVGNLYVAGSSVFPTSGYANPTLTIVALALRTADRLRSVIRPPTVATAQPESAE